MSRMIFCNKCGKQIDPKESENGLYIKRRMGYGSKYDGEYLALDLCCDCVDTIIESCKISPIKPITDDDIKWTDSF